MFDPRSGWWKEYFPGNKSKVMQQGKDRKDMFFTVQVLFDVKVVKAVTRILRLSPPKVCCLCQGHPKRIWHSLRQVFFSRMSLSHECFFGYTLFVAHTVAHVARLYAHVDILCSFELEDVFLWIERMVFWLVFPGIDVYYICENTSSICCGQNAQSEEIPRRAQLRSLAENTLININAIKPWNWHSCVLVWRCRGMMRYVYVSQVSYHCHCRKSGNSFSDDSVTPELALVLRCSTLEWGPWFLNAQDLWKFRHVQNSSKTCFHFEIWKWIWHQGMVRNFHRLDGQCQ